jgi:hypothetical protein
MTGWDFVIRRGVNLIRHQELSIGQFIPKWHQALEVSYLRHTTCDLLIAPS